MKKPVKESDEAIARLRDRLLVKIKRHLQLILSLEGLTDKARKELFDSFQQVVPDALLIGGGLCGGVSALRSPMRIFGSLE
jgi:hypothetical protein